MIKGDTVIMNDNYYVSDKNKGKRFIVLSDSWWLCGTEVVSLSDGIGAYAVDGLTVVESLKGGIKHENENDWKGESK